MAALWIREPATWTEIRRSPFRQITEMPAGETVPVAQKGDRHPALGALKGTVTVAPGVDLTEPADPDWGKVYD
jgi:hypothetical protein